jgi:P-type E1-E2 ATPase
VEFEESQAHPVAKAIFQWALTQLQSAEKKMQSIALTRSYLNAPGRGVLCEVEDNYCWYILHVGNEGFLRENGISIPSDDTEASSVGTTSVHFAIGTKHAGTLLLRDTIRAEAPAVIERVRKSGLQVTMLTGDTSIEATQVSKQLNLEILASASLPHQKQSLVSQLQSHGHKVAMVGDGLNNSLAQSTADVGILLAQSRSCMAGAADVIIMSPNLEFLASLIEISRKTMARARWNIRWAVMYNFVAIGLAMGCGERWGIKVDAPIAGTMMAFSSAGVLGMSLLLRKELRR